MAMGRRKGESQGQMFVAVVDLPGNGAPGHPFYEKLNAALRKIEFDRGIEAACEKFYDEKLGRSGIPPGGDFRMTLVGYFEGIGSDRGIAWRVSDSLSLRYFLGYDLSEATPDHSSMSRIRQRLDTRVHEEVFRLVIPALRDAGLLPPPLPARRSALTRRRWRRMPRCVRSFAVTRARATRRI